jgi:putative glutamine amidotransferase
MADESHGITERENRMRHRPVIGITSSTVENADHLKRNYAQSVWDAGGIPVALPNLGAEAVGPVLDALDGLLISGGRDVEPRLYGEMEVHPTVELDLLRDAFEMDLIREAYGCDMPILGICRGIQALNVALGGTLWQDVPGQFPATVRVQHRQTEPGAQPTHELRIQPGSRLADIMGCTTMRVNTFHHQAVRNVAPGLAVVGWAEDGLIEAVEATDRRFVIAVQYHPEEMAATCALSAGLFARFVAAAGLRLAGG